MTVQYNDGIRDGQANFIESHVGTAPTLELWSGALPADCDAADAGSKIAEGALPSDWLTAASGGNGLVQKNGTWTVTGLTAAGAGTDAVYFRIRKSGTVYMQGPCDDSAGTGKMVLDNLNIADTQVVTVTQFDLQRGNA